MTEIGIHDHAPIRRSIDVQDGEGPTRSHAGENDTPVESRPPTSDEARASSFSRKGTSPIRTEFAIFLLTGRKAG